MIFIANYWNNTTAKEVKVFSNCDEVDLLLNGQLLAREKPDTDQFADKLMHPPFTFQISKFAPGILTAIGFINGKEMARSTQQTPGMPSRIQLSIDYSGKAIQSGKPDIVFVYARIADANGTLLTNAQNIIKFAVKGNGELIGVNPIKVESGIATILLKTGNKSGEITITAGTENLNNATIKVEPTPVKYK